VGYTVHPDDLGTILQDVSRRIHALETTNQLGSSSIQDGALIVLDNDGVTRVMVGELPDGTWGVGVLDPSGSGDITNIEAMSWGVQATEIDLSEGTSSTGYTDLATPGPTVTATVGESGRVKLTASAFLSAPANTSASVGLYQDGSLVLDVLALGNSTPATIAVNASSVRVVDGLSPGAHVWELKYRTSSGTSTFAARTLIVEPL
jgi:hypothetical protein